MVQWWFNFSFILLGGKLVFFPLFVSFFFFSYFLFLLPKGHAQGMGNSLEVGIISKCFSSEFTPQFTLQQVFMKQQGMAPRLKNGPDSHGIQLWFFTSFSQASGKKEKERGEKSLKLHYHTQGEIPVATGCLG